MGIGIPGLLEKFTQAEIQSGKRVFKLNNVSRRPTGPEGFQHVPVQGTLEVEVSSGEVIATAQVVSTKEDDLFGKEPEKVKRMINSAYKVPITGANAYDPGSNITLYSYPSGGFPGWSFHCDLPKES
jgi:hypothetical protein